jgi:hypothetical protein
MKTQYVGFTNKKDGTYVPYSAAWPLITELNTHFNRLAASKKKDKMLDWNFSVTKKIKRPFAVLELKYESQGDFGKIMQTKNYNGFVIITRKRATTKKPTKV